MSECVYFIDTADGKFVKIGYSNDILKRLSGLNVSSPHRLSLRGWIYGGREKEKEIHERFAYYRGNGEWFRRAPVLEEFISSLPLNNPDGISPKMPVRRNVIPVSEKIGRLSDLIDIRHRADWSKLNDKIKALEPGQVITEACPRDMSISAFRSTVLTSGRRLHTGDWKLSTRTYGRTLHCFLAPKPVDKEAESL